MSHEPKNPIDDKTLFRQSLGRIKKMKQDTIRHPKSPLSSQKRASLRQRQKEDHCHFYFSDLYCPLLEYDPIRYSREGFPSQELKKLKRGEYIPDIFLDLHGLTQEAAKREIASLLTDCLKRRIGCACIIFGHGKHILKQQTPRWLAQHPDILCFHQAPKEYGGSAALLILIDVDSDVIR